MTDHDTRRDYWYRTELSYRARNCLITAEIDNIAALLRYSDAQLLLLPNLGKRTFREIKDWLGRQTTVESISQALLLVSDEDLLVEVHRRLKARAVNSHG